MAAVETWNQMKLTYGLLTTTVSRLVAPATPQERQEAMDGIGGPIAAGGTFAKMAEAGASVGAFLILAALRSVNLGVFNLLPLPALDGGRLAFLAVWLVLAPLGGSAAWKQRAETIAHSAGFILLLALGALIAAKDVFGLFPR